MRSNPDRWYIQQAYLAHSRDKGTFVHITVHPLRAVIAAWVGDRLFGLINPPEWTWRLRWGPRDVEFGLADWSLGHQLYRLGQWCGSGFGTGKLEKTIAEISLTPAQVLEHFPDADPLFWEAHDDELGGDAARWMPADERLSSMMVKEQVMGENWRKSSRSNSQGACVEAGSWRKTSYSSPTGANCVEAGYGAGTVGVRDTKDHGRGPVLEFTPQAWAAFTGGLK